MIVNGDFESGETAWTESPDSGLPIITMDAANAHAGNWDAWLGGYISGTDTLTQDVTIPAERRPGEPAVLVPDRHAPKARRSTAYDVMTVSLVNPSNGATLTTLATLLEPQRHRGPVGAQPVYDVSAYKGQTVRLKFSAMNDSSNFTSFRIDDVTLNAASTNYTALWWNPSESGWGINFDHQGDILFGTLFTYDASGNPLWLVMSDGARQAGTQTFTGALYQTTGPAFNANPFTPDRQRERDAGGHDDGNLHLGRHRLAHLQRERHQRDQGDPEAGVRRAGRRLPAHHRLARARSPTTRTCGGTRPNRAGASTSPTRATSCSPPSSPTTPAATGCGW